MKYLILLLLSFSVSAQNLEPRAEAKGYGEGRAIVVSGFADLGEFESYECKVDFGTWVYSIKADKSVDNEYRCIDAGYLSRGTEYRVDFVHYQWPENAAKPITSFYIQF